MGMKGAAPGKNPPADEMLFEEEHLDFHHPAIFPSKDEFYADIES